MAQINHNTSTPNDDLGDQLRTAFGNQNTMNTELYDTKVDKVTGKGLTENEFTNALKDKLDGIDLDAQINVQADWEQEDDTADDYIKNKPTEYFTSVGSFLYADLATQTTPLSGVANVEKNLTNDIDGDETNLSNAPYAVNTLWDSATNKLDFLQLSIGDVVNLRTNLKVTTSTSNQNIHVYARIGIGTSSEKEMLIGSKFVETAGEFTFDEELTIIFSKVDYIASVGELFLLSENDSTIKVQEFEFLVIKKNINLIEIDGITDLSTTRTPTNVQINSNTGTPALIGLGNGTNAGVSLNDYTTAEKDKLADTYITSEVDDFLDLKADDSIVVHLSGNETISGIKTFLTGMLGLRNVANTFTSFFLNTNTAARTYTLQDRSGTLADNTDLALKANLASPTFTGSVVVPNATLSTEAVNKGQLDLKANTNTTVQTTKTASTYTLVLSDASSIIPFSFNGAITATIPNNASVAFPIGTVVGFSVITGTTSALTISGAGVTILGIDTYYNNDFIYLIKTDTDTWTVDGVGKRYPLFTNTVSSADTQRAFKANGNGSFCFSDGVSGMKGNANGQVWFDSWVSTINLPLFNFIGQYLTQGSGVTNIINFSDTINPAGGTSVFNSFNLSPTINQTGGANGITRSLYINPTLTSAADFRAIEVTNGSVLLPYKAVTSTYTVLNNDYTIDATSGTFTITLPTAVGCQGRIYNIKNSGTGVITIDGNSSETIDGALTRSLVQWETLTIQSTNAGWIIL